MGARLGKTSLAPLFARFRGWFDSWMVMATVGVSFAGGVALVRGAQGELVQAIILGTVAAVFILVLVWQIRQNRFLREWMLSYESRRESVESELKGIRQDAADGTPPEVLLGYLDFEIDQILCLASSITDHPEHALSA